MKKILAVLAMVLMLAGTAFADSNIIFIWDANSESDLAGYRLYQSQTSGNYVDTFVSDIPAGTETVTISDVADGIYYWVLTAYDTDDNESGYSNEVMADLDTLAPDTPTNVVITVIIKVQ